MDNKHTNYDLAQMQSLPLCAKERMSTQRLKVWFESWNRYKLVNKKTGRIVYKVSIKEPKLTKNQYIDEVESGACYVSFSAGKDSTVLADLTARFCKDYGYKLVLLFINTGLEYPEIQKHALSYHKYLEEKYDMEIELVVRRPEMRFDRVLTTYGYPVISKEVAQVIREAKIGIEKGSGYEYRIKKLNGELPGKDGKPSQYNIDKYKYLLDAPFNVSEECCTVMKKKPAKRFEKERAVVPIMGVMASESRQRKQRWIRHGCNAFDGGKKGPSSNPLSFWTEQDILQYILKYDLPIASVYGDIVYDEKKKKYYTTGVDRTGCVFCLFGAHCKGDCRFLNLKDTHPKQYNYCINGGEYNEYGKLVPNKDGLGIGKILDYIGASDKY